MQRVVFEGATIAEIVAKCRRFIGEAERPAPPTFGSRSANTWLVPSWAPSGSRWLTAQRPPVLVAPDGEEVHVQWVAGTPQKPRKGTS